MLGKKMRISFSFVLLALFITFKASLVLFAHVHIINGVTIVHSHPYSDKNHNHSLPQVVTIASAASLQAVEPVTVKIVEVVRPLLCEMEHVSGVPSLSVRHAPCLRLRAPPFCCLHIL